MAKPRLLAILSEYPQLSQTYKENELRALMPYVELKIASYAKHDTGYHDHLPFSVCRDPAQILVEARAFGPHQIHGHYYHLIPILHRAAEICGCRWTVRTHSFDVLGKSREYLERWRNQVNSPRCAGLFCFPFVRERLLEAGLAAEKVHAAWPVVDVQRFLDASANGNDVMNTGAGIPKKQMSSFVDLAVMVPERQFRLYPIGYETEQLKSYNESKGSPVEVAPCVEPMNMLREYKRYGWLVYTASPSLATVGWPMAIAEAQAAGLGILMQNIRPDLSDYIGEAGFLFDTTEQAASILRQPYPDSMRKAGFEQAKRSDLRVHLLQLMKLWGWTRH